jgi:hypothetical protein
MFSASLRRIYHRRHGDNADGSLLFAIESALEGVRFGSRDDESLASAANKIVRRELDKHAISYADYKEWRRQNPLVFTSVVDDGNQLIGFFDIFPLTVAAGADVISGKITERSLTVDHIVPLAGTSSATYLHIATILRNPRQKRFSSLVAKEVLLLKMKEFLRKHYEPLGERTYTAFAQSPEGEALLKRCGFAMILLSEQNEQHCPLYVLRPAETAGAIERFERADELFSSRSKIKTLDAKLETIELQLRTLIASIVGSDPRQLPSEINERAQERIANESKRNAAFDSARYKFLPAKLEFCDLRELEKVLINKLLWPKFKDRFGSQEALTIRFGQVSALRNALRHSRHVDDIARTDGEAAIMWFERVLSKSLEAM